MPRHSSSVVITTFNRCSDLRHTCEQLRKLLPPPDEIIICLDGCTDDSKAMLEAEFPECITLENATPQGSITARDRAFRMVTSELIVSLDDDSYPLDPAFLEKVSLLVDQHPEAGAFSFPEIRNGGMPASPLMGPDSPGHYIKTFPNCAGVMLRSLYGSTASYPTFFSHAYAEPDYCLQLYAAGMAVWFEPSLLIRHHFSPHQRNMLSRHRLNARNELWSVLMRCPLPFLLIIAPLRILRQFLYALKMGPRWWLSEPLWWWNALVGVRRCLANRNPVSWRAYQAWIRLGRSPINDIADLRQSFGWH